MKTNFYSHSYFIRELQKCWIYKWIFISIGLIGYQSTALSAQGCPSISFILEELDPCCYALILTNSSECTPQLTLVLDSGQFTSWSAGNGFTITQNNPSELLITHVSGIIPFGQSTPVQFCITEGTSPTLSLLYDFVCGLGESCSEDIPIAGCPAQDTCIAAFGYVFNSPCGLLQFQDQSQGLLPISYSWNFGDPASGIQNTSALQNPIHQFSAMCAIYNVCLTITTTDGCSNTICEEIALLEFEPPVITCPEDIVVSCDDQTTPAYTGTATALDNCDLNPIINYTDEETGNYPCDYQIIREWIAEDKCDNLSVCTQIITVLDTVPPMLSNCPGNQSVEGIIGGNGQCSANVIVISPTPTDNCDPNVTLSNNFNNTANASGNYPVGTTTVEWTATDECGNTATCSFTITVECLPAEESMFKCGMAVVTCFSGFNPGTTSANPAGPVLAVVDVRNHASAPLGVNWGNASLVHLPDWESKDMGQLFGVTIDNNYNIYASSTTMYGRYAPSTITNADFGNVYRIDAVTGLPSIFTTLPQNPSAPAGLGDVLYDAQYHQIFVSNFYDGLIYRYEILPSGIGQLLQTYNFPGQALVSASPGFVPLGDRVWALATHNGRLYFSVWNEDRFRALTNYQNEIWSVALDANSTPPGAIIPTSLPSLPDKIMPPLTTIDPCPPSCQPACLPGCPPAPTVQLYSSPVSDIAFSESGTMLIAERSMNFDFGDAAGNGGHQAHASRIMELSGPLWSNEKIFYIGNGSPLSHANSAGGADYGYESFDPAIHPLPALCDSVVWGTGDALRYPGNNILLDPGGLPCGGSNVDRVYGLTGIPSSGNSNLSSPPNTYVKNSSIYIDLDHEICINDKIYIGDVDVFKNCIECPDLSGVPCDSLMVMISPDQGNSCCYTVDIKNLAGLSMSKLRIDILAPGVIFNTSQLGAGLGFQYVASNSDKTLCISHNTGIIPAGITNGVLHFCYSDVDPGETPQVLKFTWWQNVNGSEIPTMCMDTFYTECIDEPFTDTCIVVNTVKVECDPNNVYQYQLTFNVTNLSSIPAFNAFTVNLFGLPPGFTFSPCVGPSASLSNIGIPIPGAPLAPSNTSGNMCVKIISSIPILSPTTICMQAKLIGITDCCTTPTQFCFTLDPCCDPCEEISIQATKIQVDTTCCYDLSVINNCPYPYFTKIEAEINTLGVQFGYYAINSAFLGFWNINISNFQTKLTVQPIGGHIPGGSLSNLFSFCLDNINSPSQIPQYVTIKWITPGVNGMDSVACDTVLEFNCEPIIGYKCLAIDSMNIICLPGQDKYMLTFNVMNMSQIPFSATSLDLILHTPSDLVFSPSASIPFSTPLASGNSQTVSVCLFDTDGLPGSGNILFTPKLSFQSGDTCCFENIPTSIPLPPCDTCYCADPGFTDLYLHGPGIPSFPISCEHSYENIGCPVQGNGYTFSGKFDCLGASCASMKYVDWIISGPSGTNFGSVPATPFFAVSIIPTYIAQPGIYTMSLISFCGFDTCKCEFQFVVDCANPCPCDTLALLKNVNNGFAVHYDFNSCNTCFTPTSLSDCERVDWYLVDTPNWPLGQTIGNQTLCYDLMEPGTYTIWMNVTSLNQNGVCSDPIQKYQTIHVSCGSSPTCDNSVFVNPGFDDGAIVGDLSSDGESKGWKATSGEPSVVEGSPGSLDGWSIELSGNYDTADALTSEEPVCLEKTSGTMSLRYGIRERGIKAAIIIAVYRGDEFEAPNQTGHWNPIRCLKPIEIDLDPLDSEWKELIVPYDLSDWIALDTCDESPGVLVRPAIYVTNRLNSSQGGVETPTVIHLDEFCMDGTLVAVEPIYPKDRIRIFPNPSRGELFIEFDQSPSLDTRIQILDLAGRIISYKKVESHELKQQINTNDIPPGLHFLQIYEKGRLMMTDKFVKQ